jgi:hypothetical protein
MNLPPLGLDLAKLKFNACLVRAGGKLRHKVFTVPVQTAETERTNVAPGLTSCGERCFPHVRY